MASVTTAFEVSELAPGLPFGARVSGLTLAALSNEAVRKRLYDLWIDKGVVLFRDCESSSDMQIALSKVFGPLEEHMFPDVHYEGHKDLVKVKYYPDDGTNYQIGDEKRGGWLPWHSDLVYNPRINHGGILRPHTLPRRLGQTGFVCQIAAYDRLPQNLRERIEGLNVVYEIRIDLANFEFNRSDHVTNLRLAKSGAAIEKRRFTYPRVIHPMVYTQEETGRKVLNVSPTFAVGIYEDGTHQGDALLQEVCDVCMAEDLAYFHDWRMDDMVLWDNWRVLHCAPGVEIDDTRVVLRTTISGDYAKGRPLGLDGPMADFDM